MGPARDHIIATFLELAVPLEMGRLAAQGGPNNEHWAEAHAFAHILAEHGDALLYRVTTGRHTTARLFVGLVRALAVLAYTPGGVTFAGRHWESMTRHRANV